MTLYNNVVIDTNFVLSYYGRNKFDNFIDNNIKDNTFLYINKKRSRNLSNSAKVQFFGKLKGYNFDTIIRQTRANVKRELKENGTVEQKISSAKTSIAQIPALFKHKDVVFGETNIDIGGGRFDLATNYLAEMGTKNYVFDPYNRSEEVNTSFRR